MLPPVVARSLTQAGFAAYGDVLASRGAARRTQFPNALPHGALHPAAMCDGTLEPAAAPLRAARPAAAAARPALWVSRMAAAQPLPLRIGRMERHRHAAQSFVPLCAGRWLVLVAPDAPDGGPDATRVLAFLAGPDAGVCYRPGTWHGSLAVLDAPAEFVVLMSDAGHADDDEFWPVTPFLVTE